jgi:hypothetical protein
MSLLEDLLYLVFGGPRYPLYRNRIVDAWRVLRCQGDLFYAEPGTAPAGGADPQAEPSARAVEVFCTNDDKQCERCPRFHGYRKAATHDLEISEADLRELELLNGNREGAEVAHGEVEAVALRAAGDKDRVDNKPCPPAPPCVPCIEQPQQRTQQSDSKSGGVGPCHAATDSPLAPEVKS